jgi:hypothetical protein
VKCRGFSRSNKIFCFLIGIYISFIKIETNDGLESSSENKKGASCEHLLERVVVLTFVFAAGLPGHETGQRDRHKGRMRIALFALSFLFPSALCFTGTVLHTLHDTKLSCELRRHHCCRQLSQVHKLSMQASNDSRSRRDMLVSTAASTLMAGFGPIIAQIESASAQIPGFDTRGERPSGLGPIAGGRFLSLCSNENCVSTSEGAFLNQMIEFY